MAQPTNHESLWRARELMDARYAQPLDLDELARTAHFSRYHFLRAFRAATGRTPHRFVLDHRLARAAHEAQRTTCSSSASSRSDVSKYRTTSRASSGCARLHASAPGARSAAARMRS